MEYLFISTTLTMTLLLFYFFLSFRLPCLSNDFLGKHEKKIGNFLKKKIGKKVSAPVPIPKLDPGFGRTLVGTLFLRP